MLLTHYHMSAGEGQKGLILALVSDVHESDPVPILQRLGELHPDLICITGDTFERHDTGEPPQRRKKRSQYDRLLTFAAHQCSRAVYFFLGRNPKEHDPEGVYRLLEGIGRVTNRQGQSAKSFLSLGNHEWYLNDRDRETLHRAGITFLDNADVLCEGCGIRFGGLSSDADEAWLREFAQKPEYKILLCHHPEYYDEYLRNQPIDLILSGHAHGGQLRIFGRGVFCTGQGFFPKYHHGIYHGRLVVSAGCANTTSIPRWGNPCEIVVIHLE